MVNLHNRLAAKDSTINYLRSLKSKSYEVVEDLERQLRHKQLQLIQARDQLGNTAQDIENLTRQLNERDELISVLRCATAKVLCTSLMPIESHEGLLQRIHSFALPWVLFDHNIGA